MSDTVMRDRLETKEEDRSETQWCEIGYEFDLKNSIAMASPMPEEAPTTHTVFPV